MIGDQAEQAYRRSSEDHVIAAHLYGKDEWTMQRIANALNVDKATVSRDLELLQGATIKKPAKTESNPKGAGRPKGSGGKSNPRVRGRITST
jgi:hypothetical protein